MICPFCGVSIRLRKQIVSGIMREAGRKGGSSGTGAAKVRNVDYSAIGRLGAAARKAKRECTT